MLTTSLRGSTAFGSLWIFPTTVLFARRMITTLHAFKRSLKSSMIRAIFIRAATRACTARPARRSGRRRSSRRAAECAPIAAARLKRLRKKAISLKSANMRPASSNTLRLTPNLFNPPPAQKRCSTTSCFRGLRISASAAAPLNGVCPSALTTGTLSMSGSMPC